MIRTHSIRGGLAVAASLALGVLTGGAAQAAPSPLEPGAVVKDCPTCTELVLIPPGEVTMGSDLGEPDRNELPLRKITIGYSFLAAAHSVTNAEFGRFIQATGHKPGTNCILFIAAARDIPNGAGYKVVAGADWTNPGYGRVPAPNEPVVCVDWKDAKAYVSWLSKTVGKPYRLLSEAEWEYAANPGGVRPFTWGSDPEDACKFSNLYDAAGAEPSAPWPATKCSDGFKQVAPVKSFPPNRFGLYDMIGNTWQWVQDCHVMPRPAEPADGRPVEVDGACPLRGVKGGSWATTVKRMRPQFRGRDPENQVSGLFGFRIARDLGPDGR